MHDMIRSTGTWVLTPAGWFAPTRRIEVGELPSEVFLYDHEGVGHRKVPSDAILRAEQVDSEAVYEGHWIPLVSTWTHDMVRAYAPLPRSDGGYLAVLYTYSSPEWNTLITLPGAEVHDDRGGNGGVSFVVALDALDGYRQTATTLIPASADDEQEAR
ncbi:hypothetical protein [Microbacterium sp. VKM Ac-2923]|uniref:hypothetical protein n=1 Tax=Microbacterium sp. VKM Ac-2923 TaxID=2929476 RepID=UPI001FB25B56|nr:hypothetical protein [Microbacterium sp. VKM Ac-2923]MCJ1708342.1 hypothetical protein [Microbacterium sp. VKM Ac-2923]